MTESDIVEFVRGQVVRSGVDPAIGLDDDLFDAGFDSVALVTLLAAFEEEFGVGVDESSVVPRNFQTVRLIASLFADCRSQA